MKIETRWAALAVGICGLVGTASAQRASVESDEGRVVVDGDYVRIESPDGVTEVSGEWRHGGRVAVRNTDDLLVDLGAVEGTDHIRLDLAGDILFELGSAVVTEAAGEVLHEVAQVIRDRALGEVLVLGHTDAIGDAGTNQRLSEARALSVIRWLEGHEGIPAPMLVGRGLGERRPVAPNTTRDGRDDPGGRARNRRVELFLGTTERADVRAAAGLVTVSSPVGAVVVDEDRDRVDIGGLVQVDDGSVDVGGVHVSSTGSVTTRGGARTAGGSQATTCSAGKFCHADCPEGECRMTCSAGANCDYECRGGDCEMLCSAGATCELGCTGGDCRFSCALGSTCETSCAGGGCTGA